MLGIAVGVDTGLRALSSDIFSIEAIMIVVMAFVMGGLLFGIFGTEDKKRKYTLSLVLVVMALVLVLVYSFVIGHDLGSGIAGGSFIVMLALFGAFGVYTILLGVSIARSRKDMNWLGLSLLGVFMVVLVIGGSIVATGGPNLFTNPQALWGGGGGGGNSPNMDYNYSYEMRITTSDYSTPYTVYIPRPSNQDEFLPALQATPGVQSATIESFNQIPATGDDQWLKIVCIGAVDFKYYYDEEQTLSFSAMGNDTTAYCLVDTPDFSRQIRLEGKISNVENNLDISYKVTDSISYDSTFDYGFKPLPVKLDHRAG